jgi:hypothetical protein
MIQEGRLGILPVLPLAARAGGHFLALPNTSSRLHFNRSKICWSRPNVILCSQFSSLNSMDGENPVFFEKATNDISPLVTKEFRQFSVQC